MKGLRTYRNVSGLKVLVSWTDRRCICGKFLGLHQHYCKKCFEEKNRENKNRWNRLHLKEWRHKKGISINYSKERI